MRQVRAPVDLRHRRHEVALRHVADRQHVEEAVVRRGLGADLHAAAEVAPVRDDDVVHPAAPALAVDGHLEVGRRPAGEDRERRPEVRRLPAERLRGRVRALRDRAAHPRARDVREDRDALAPVPGAERRAPEVDRAHVARERDLGRLLDLRAGSRTSARSPSPCRGGRRRARAPRRAPRARSPTSFTEPSPPTTTSSRAPPSAASRASSARWPCRSLRSASPSSPVAAARRASSGQRRPVAPFADAGLTRKTVSPARVRPSRWRARAPSSGRRRSASPRR